MTNNFRPTNVLPQMGVGSVHFMKIIICISFAVLLNASTICYGQVRDSVCIHNFTKNYWQSIRKIDSTGYVNYTFNSEYFTKYLRKDSLFIKPLDNQCLPKTIFVGEYITNDSIHFIDFINIVRPQLRVCLESICNKYISRNQLPLIHRLTLCTNVDSVEVFDYDLYIQLDSGISAFKLKGTELPQNVQNKIMSLKENQFIATDNVRIITPDGVRTIDGTTYLIKN
jgi:hypothetical protein